MRETPSIDDEQVPDEHPLFAITSWLWCGMALAFGLWTMVPGLRFLVAAYAMYLFLIPPLAAAARRHGQLEAQRLAEGMRSEPGPFAYVPQRPFEQRLKAFATDTQPSSVQSATTREPGLSRMRFYLGVIPRYSYRPKSAAYIREILERIRRTLRGGP